MCGCAQEINDYKTTPNGEGVDHTLKVVKEYVDEHGAKKVDGAADLKGTQHYTLDFGRAIQQVFENHKDDIAAP